MEKIKKVLWRLFLGLLVATFLVNWLYFGWEDTILRVDQVVKIVFLNTALWVIGGLKTLIY